MSRVALRFPGVDVDVDVDVDEDAKHSDEEDDDIYQLFSFVSRIPSVFGPYRISDDFCIM